jgi:MarR family transcriptional regulator for hemolysin
MNQRELAARLGVEAPTLARLLDRLAADGWIERRANAHDRRVKSIHLLPKAAGVIRQIDKAMNEMRAEVLRGMPASNVKTSLKVLQIIRTRTEQASQAAKKSSARKPK